MNEYIERGAAIKSLLNDSPKQVGYCREDAADCIRYMDAADVAPVRHGRWIAIKVPNEWDKGQCSECRSIFNSSVWGTNYCPNCGAKMDGGAD